MTFQQVNKKIHIYTGLLLFLFIFLFAFSGFMLNHRWEIWDFWSSRIEHTEEISVDIPQADTDLEKAQKIISQIDAEGEIHFIAHHVQTNEFEIKTTRPGQKTTIKVNLTTGKGEINIIDLNGWELLPSLHAYTGLHSNIEEKKNWFWTEIWSVMMDITAIGLIVLLASGLYMWLKQRSERRIGLILLETGSVVFILLFWILSKF